MKNIFAILILTILTSATIVPIQPIKNATLAEKIEQVENFEKGKLIYNEGMKISDVESFIGRKMNLSEKISFLFDKETAINKISNAPEGVKRYNTLAIIGLALSLMLLSPFAMVLSIIALIQIKKKKQFGKELAILGLSLGTLGTVFMILLLTIGFQ